MILTIPVGQMAANCYLVSDGTTGKALIVDPGDDADHIRSRLADASLSPQAIYATHGHFDHIMAAYELVISYGIPFIIHQEDEFLLQRMVETARHFLGYSPDLPAPEPASRYRVNETLICGKLRLQVICVPGHTPGSVALYNQQQGYVIVGDLMFKGGGVGRTDFSYGDAGKLAASVKQILKLPASTVIYPGHGEPTTVGKESRFFSGGV